MYEYNHYNVLSGYKCTQHTVFTIDLPMVFGLSLLFFSLLLACERFDPNHHVHCVQKMQRSIEERLASAAASARLEAVSSASPPTAPSARPPSTSTSPSPATVSKTSPTAPTPRPHEQQPRDPLDAVARIPGVQVFRPGDPLLLSDTERQVLRNEETFAGVRLIVSSPHYDLRVHDMCSHSRVECSRVRYSNGTRGSPA